MRRVFSLAGRVYHADLRHGFLDRNRSDSSACCPDHFLLETGPPRQIIIMLVCVLVFALALDNIGFLPAAFLFLFITLNLFYRRGWRRSFIIALIALTIIYLIFRGVFLVILPEGEWTTSFIQMISSIQISFIK
ncbi:tripartite tricarboxylate transporter TctB family protein [Vibrio sp. PP-XX7]